MKTENWIKTETLLNYQQQALKLVEEKKKWEKKQIQRGKKEVLIPHPTSPRAFIIKYI